MKINAQNIYLKILSEGHFILHVDVFHNNYPL